MKVLVLGDSDSTGAFSGGKAWPDLIEEWLRQRGDPEPTVRVVRFSAVPQGAAAYAEKKIAEEAPDVVILLAGAFSFTFGFVEYRVRRLLGERPARLYKRLESRFDRRTRRAGAAPSGANGLARRLARSIIGVEPITTREVLTDHFLSVFRALAKAENTQVIVVAYPGIDPSAHIPPKNAERPAFFADLEFAARGHHFTWVALEPRFTGFDDWRAYGADSLHFNELGHQIVGEAIILAFPGKAGTG